MRLRYVDYRYKNKTPKQREVTREKNRSPEGLWRDFRVMTGEGHRKLFPLWSLTDAPLSDTHPQN